VNNYVVPKVASVANDEVVVVVDVDAADTDL